MKKYFLVSLITATVIGYAQKADDKKIKWTKTASGLEYVITKKTTGVQPAVGDKVSVHYTGKLLNDTVFDSSIPRGKPFDFKLGTGAVIKGWDEGLALLHEGEKALLRIPAELGYGARNMGKIPSNSILIFEVELVKVMPGVKPYDVKGKDTITTSSGLKYILVKENKAGKKVEPNGRVVMHYSAYFSDGRPMDSSVERGQPQTCREGKGDMPKGVDEAMTILRTGEKARLVIPYQLAFGEEGRGGIPPKATVVFDMEMIEVKPPIVVKPYDVKGKDTITTPTGLKYIVVSKSNGTKAVSGKQVKAHYTGYLLDGKIFDSSVERDMPLPLTVGIGQVIKGWDEGLQLMSVGDKFRFIIPSALGYGEQGAGASIPANSTLIFDVEMVEVQ